MLLQVKISPNPTICNVFALASIRSPAAFVAVRLSKHINNYKRCSLSIYIFRRTNKVISGVPYHRAQSIWFETPTSLIVKKKNQRRKIEQTNMKDSHCESQVKMNYNLWLWRPWSSCNMNTDWNHEGSLSDSHNICIHMEGMEHGNC